MDIKKQNLSKIATKNSLYALAFAIINKFGGLILTIILARLLLPELFGVYSLVLSIMVLVIILADFGSDLTSTRYLAKALEKNDKRTARSIFRFLFKTKSLIILLLAIILLVLARPLSYRIFDKPLMFWPLIFSCLLILVDALRSLFGTPFTAKKEIQVLLPLELIFQSSKIVLSVIALSILSYEFKIAGIFIAFTLAGILYLILEVLVLIKKDKEILSGDRVKINTNKILRYMVFAGTVGITLVFFGSVDTLMLGKFVDAEYLGYYRVALGLVISLAAILPFSGTLLPIFTQIHGKRLDRGVKKSLEYLLILVIPMSVGLIFISKQVILLIYGKEYIMAALPLLVLSPLIVVTPLISLYSTLFQATEKPQLLAKFMVVSLLINIILNLIFIKQLLPFGQEYALLGSGAATLLSNLFFLYVLANKTKYYFKINLELKKITKPILSTLIMAGFLYAFMYYVDLNILLGLIMILLATSIYFLVMFIIGGITKEDLKLLSALKK